MTEGLWGVVQILEKSFKFRLSDPLDADGR